MSTMFVLEMKVYHSTKKELGEGKIKEIIRGRFEKSRLQSVRFKVSWKDGTESLHTAHELRKSQTKQSAKNKAYSAWRSGGRRK